VSFRIRGGQGESHGSRTRLTVRPRPTYTGSEYEKKRQFDVITDSGVFHVFDDEERPVYVNSLRSALRPGGMYYLMCFSDRQPGDWGPRRVSQAELRAAFVDGWSIRSIDPAMFADTIDDNGAQAWLATIERL